MREYKGGGRSYTGTLDLLAIKLLRLLEIKRDIDEIYEEGIFANSFGHDIDSILSIIISNQKE